MIYHVSVSHPRKGSSMDRTILVQDGSLALEQSGKHSRIVVTRASIPHPLLSQCSLAPLCKTDGTPEPSCTIVMIGLLDISIPVQKKKTVQQSKPLGQFPRAIEGRKLSSHLFNTSVLEAQSTGWLSRSLRPGSRS